jgi:hypothetical protein
MKFIPRREGKRKAVTASRATESGQPDDWDTPYVHPTGPSNKELTAASDAKKAARNEALNTPMKPVTFSKTQAPPGNEYRLTSYGDD